MHKSSQICPIFRLDKFDYFRGAGRGSLAYAKAASLDFRRTLPLSFLLAPCTNPREFGLYHTSSCANKKTPYRVFRWRRKRDSNPRGLSPKRFSRPPRYDRFDIPASYLTFTIIPCFPSNVNDFLSLFSIFIPKQNAEHLRSAFFLLYTPAFMTGKVHHLRIFGERLQ